MMTRTGERMILRGEMFRKRGMEFLCTGESGFLIKMFASLSTCIFSKSTIKDPQSVGTEISILTDLGIFA